RVRFPELSYANADDPPLKRGLIRFLERLAGRDYFAPLHEQWRSETLSRSQRTIRPMLGLIDVELEIVARQWPPQVQPDRRLPRVALRQGDEPEDAQRGHPPPRRRDNHHRFSCRGRRDCADAIRER